MARTPKAPKGPRLNFPIFAVALFGVLVVTHLWIQVQRGFTHGCFGFATPTGEIAECAAVVGSQFGAVAGVSNVLLGGLFYLVIAGLRFGIAMTSGATARKLQQASFFAVGAGLLYAGYLVGVQMFAVEAYCKLCLVSSGTTAVLFGLHLMERRGAGEAAVMRAVSPKPYAFALAGLLVLAAADVALFSDRVEDPLSTQVAASGDGLVRPTADRLADVCILDNEAQDLRVFDLIANNRRIISEGGGEGAARAIKVFDPNCPHCKTMHAMLEEALPQTGESLRIYYQPIALWDFSTPQIQAFYLAQDAGREQFLGMLDLQMESPLRPIPVDTLVAFANRVGMDGEAMRTQIQTGRYRDLIAQDRALMAGSGVNSVPRLYIEGKLMANTSATWTPECIQYLAEQATRG